MYVVIDNSIDPKSGNKLLLGKFIFGEFTEVKPLSEEEYEEVSEYCLTLVSAIEKLKRTPPAARKAKMYQQERAYEEALRSKVEEKE